MTGEPIEDAHFQRAARQRCARTIGWDFERLDARPDAVDGGRKARAKGLSCIIKGTVTPSTSTAAAKLNDDGSLQVLTSSVEMGQGLQTAMAFLAAEAMAIAARAGQRHLRRHGRARRTTSRPARAAPRRRWAARSSGAIDEIKEQAARPGVGPAGGRRPTTWSSWTAGCGRRTRPTRGLDYGEVVRRDRAGNIQGSGAFQTKGGLDPDTGLGIGSVHWHQAAGAAEVEVDLETGHVSVLRYHAGGLLRAAPSTRSRPSSQTEGNVAFGLGQALYEEMIYDDGQLQNGNLGDYMIASIKDMPPELTLDVLEHPEAQRDPRHRRDLAAAGDAGDRQRHLPRHGRAHPRPAHHRREGPARPARSCARNRRTARRAASHGRAVPAGAAA